jgi:hypothetical protein
MKNHAAVEIDFEQAAPNHLTSHDHMGAVTVGTGCVVEVASDRNAMVEALAEYGYRMLMEHGSGWEHEVTMISVEAKRKTLDKLADELKQKAGK